MTSPLAGILAKLRRAHETFETLRTEVDQFCKDASASIRVEGRHSSDGLRYSLIARGAPLPPLRFSVLTGEFVHHLRSCLDHLVCLLVTQNGQTPGVKNQYPICATREGYERALRSGYITGVSDSARAIIESTQPYLTPTPRDAVLYALHELDIRDKHRLLVILSATGLIGETIEMGSDKTRLSPEDILQLNPPNIVALAPLSAISLTLDGGELFWIALSEPAPHFYAKAMCKVVLAIETCGEAANAPLLSVLRGLYQGTSHTIESFRGEFSKGIL